MQCLKTLKELLTMQIEDGKLEKNALNKAWEIRNYEINMYWKRAGYFWAFITTIIVAFYYVIQSDKLGHKYVFITSLLGVAFSLAWFYSNIASKHWQENWENHIDLLEDKYYGRLYKTVLSQYKTPAKPSVSRINLKLSFLAFIALTYVYFINNTDYKFSIPLYLMVILYMSFNEKIRIKNIFQLLFCNKDHQKTYICSGDKESREFDYME